MNIIFILVVFFYILLTLLFTFSFRNPSAATSELEPKISIIVAVRNEAQNLSASLQSLRDVNYPLEKYEIVIVDDNSNDDSPEIIKRFAADPLFRCIHMNENQKTRPGKAGAILEGINQSRGEIIFVTDADCRVPRNWVKNLLRYFDKDTGLVGGFTLLDRQGDNASRWEKIQSCDLSYLLGIAAASAHLKKPVSWLGNNMAFRRTAYDEVGGYAALGHSLVEDFALINAIAGSGKWNVVFTHHPDSLVTSRPSTNMMDFYQQRKRWISGMNRVPMFGLFVMASSFLGHLVVVAAFLLLPIKLAVAGLFFFFIADFIFLFRVLASLHRKDLLRYFFDFEWLYFAYTLLLPFLHFFDRKIRWKNESYDHDGNYV